MHSSKWTLPSAIKNTRWRLVFAECLTTGTRQTLTDVSRFDGWRQRWPRAQILPGAYPAALGKCILCWVLDFCRVLELGKSGMYRVRNLCRVSVNRHSANMMFAECPWFGTRQRNEHSAYMPFPVSKEMNVSPQMQNSPNATCHENSLFWWQCNHQESHESMKDNNLQSFSDRPKALKHATSELKHEKRVKSKHSEQSWGYHDIIRRQKHTSKCLANLTFRYHHMSKQLAKVSLRHRSTSS